MHFKFLNTADVDRVTVDGTMMVSALSYFRKLELGEIGDPLEGSAQLTIDQPMTVTEGSPELAMLNAANIGLGSFKQFAKVEGGGQINIGANVKFVHHSPDLYIYSFSSGDIRVLTDEMCEKASEPYDACLRIKDPRQLAITCLQQGVVRNLENRPVSELFEHVGMKVVEYVPRSRDITQGPALQPDPYKKEERFRPQSEMRLLFIPFAGQQIEKDRLIFAIPDPASHFELVFRNRPKP